MIHWHHLAGAVAGVAIALAALGYFGAGMASRSTTAEDYRFPNTCLAFGVAIIILIWST